MQRYRVVIMLVLFGVLPVVAAFFVALQFLGDPEPEPEPERVEAAPADEGPPPEPPETRKVLAAARALPVRTLLGKDDLTGLEFDPAAVEEDYEDIYVVATGETTADELRKKLRGYAVRQAIAEGAPLTHSAVVGPRQKGFLTAVLRPGARAVTIRVGPATSHAGLIDPGDRVDVILSAELAVDGGERSVQARTIVEDVRVVAIDDRPGSAADWVVGGVDEKVERTEIMTATLEASPVQADRLVLGGHEGSLSLAVRSLVDAQVSDKAPAGEAVDLREMLLSSSEYSASEARRRRAQVLNDLSVRTQIVESKEQLQAATQRGATSTETVRIFRGSEPAEEVVFERR